ncbi:UrcA family protein [Brevundimonas intermedia]|uniref:UrcA family protein n=1 Tax=Brevundimonas intermedia TaxID=74315 RepID=UPI003208BEC2
MLGLASLTTAAFLAAGAAYAAPIEARISYGDLDLSSRAGAMAFDVRVQRVARNLCTGRLTVERLGCMDKVREEAMSLLPERARTEYARGRVAFEA